MSGEDDNFDIDIYGDEAEEQQPQEQQQQEGDDFDYTYEETPDQSNQANQGGQNTSQPMNSGELSSSSR